MLRSNVVGVQGSDLHIRNNWGEPPPVVYPVRFGPAGAHALRVNVKPARLKFKGHYGLGLRSLQPYGFVRISTDFLLLIRMYGSHTSPYGNCSLRTNLRNEPCGMRTRSIVRDRVPGLR